MKFTKKYDEYMQAIQTDLPEVHLKRLKKMLKQCRVELAAHAGNEVICCDGHCTVCDGTFFPLLLEEMTSVVCSFNERAKQLLEFHLASGFKKYFLWFARKHFRDSGVLVQEGRDLVTYAIINSVAMRKILKKYDKIHYSNQGQLFKDRAQRLHIEMIQSPWLLELMALYINLRQSNIRDGVIEPSGGCSLVRDDDRLMLSCRISESIRVEIDLMCSICLEMVFDPVALSCGHIFCYMCACSSASVTIVDGLKAADDKAKCPLCRQEGVYQEAARLDELTVLLSHSCEEIWEKRFLAERVERLRQAKEHWETKCQQLLGY